MTICASCGNDYARSFEVRMADGTAESFDSFECAIQRLAPQCAHCGIRVIGHGVEVQGRVFCGAHCARHAGHGGPVDRVGDARAEGDPTPQEAEVDRALEESFPASDAPSYWARDTDTAN
jgi:hypothetical protein